MRVHAWLGVGFKVMGPIEAYIEEFHDDSTVTLHVDDSAFLEEMKWDPKLHGPMVYGGVRQRTEDDVPYDTFVWTPIEVFPSRYDREAVL